MPNEKLEKLKHEQYVAEKKLTAELDDALGYSKYDYKNKDTEEIIQLMTVFSKFCI